jgi:putative hemolysin
MEPSNHGSGATPIPLDLPTDHGIPEILVRLLGLHSAAAYYLTLPTDVSLAACVEKILIDRKFDLTSIRVAARCIPQRGPLLVTSNHPTGILDGVVSLAALLSRRNDVRVVANAALCRIPILADRLIGIRKTDSSHRGNRNALMAIRSAWKRDECVIIFPAGTVAHWQWREMRVADAPWTDGVQRFAAKLDVPECRATMTIKNPLWFHGCAAISRKARTALLLRAFFAHSAKTSLSPVKFELIDSSAK